MKTITEYLETYCDELTPIEFYRRIFPVGSLEERGVQVRGKYNAIAVSIAQNGCIKRFMINDDLKVIDDLCKTDDFCLMSPISYAGKTRESKNARFLYALAIDVDGIRMKEYNGVPIGIETLFYQFDGNGPSNYLPKPSMLVMSGTGLHVYYVFEKPIPLFSNIVKQLMNFKRRLTWQLWTQGVTDLVDNVQYESLFQGFRIPGTITKDGHRARAFLVGDGKPVTMEYMNKFVLDECKVTEFTYKSELTLQEAQEKYPEWYNKRIVQRRPKGAWTASRAVYDWWKQQIYASAEDGHRYWCVMALAAYAKKCGISEQEVKQDALGMVDMLDGRGKRPDNPFTVADVMAALEAYNDSYITYPIDTISYRTGIPIKKNKRNGRKQAVHLARARAVQNVDYPNHEWAGRPKGSGTAQEKVLNWISCHPDGKKSECIRDTGLSKPTVYKWWNPEKVERDKNLEIIRGKMNDYDAENWCFEEEGVANASYHEGLLLEYGVKESGYGKNS